MTTVLIILAILGALGGVVLLWRLFQNAKRHWYARKAARDAVQSDFWYRSIELACRCDVSGQHRKSRRVADIVSSAQALERIRIGFGPATEAVFEPKLLTPSLKLRQVDPAPPSGNWVDYMIDFGKKLAKGDALQYELELTTTARDGCTIPPYWMWMSEHRVDDLVLRVTFDDGVDVKPTFQIYDQEGHVHDEQVLSIDPISRECEKRVPLARPGFTYMIQW